MPDVDKLYDCGCVAWKRSVRFVAFLFLCLIPCWAFGQSVTPPSVPVPVSIANGGTGATTPSAALSALGGTTGTQAQQTIAFFPGLLTTITNTFSGFTKVVKASTLDNIIGSAMTLTVCNPNPVVELDDCGGSTTCGTPTGMGSVTLASAGTAVSATISSSAVAAGDFLAWRIASGTCTAADVGGTATLHAN